MTPEEMGQKLAEIFSKELDKRREDLLEIKHEGDVPDVWYHNYANDVIFGQESQLLEDLGDVLQRFFYEMCKNVKPL